MQVWLDEPSLDLDSITSPIGTKTSIRSPVIFVSIPRIDTDWSVSIIRIDGWYKMEIDVEMVAMHCTVKEVHIT